jgi:hypothetical protein
MATTRDELISDWRQRLAAAEETTASSPRSAWLARMQIRLYRFLLACYGSTKWEPPTQSAESPQLVFDSAEARQLDGKPARSLGEIRSVLTAVSKAQDESHSPGPLAAGLDHDSWVVVAAASSKLKVRRCIDVLAKAGLHPRLCQRGDDQLVEVPAYERREAFDLVERHRQRLHQPPKTPRSQPVPAWASFGALGILAMWLTGLLTWAVVAFAWASIGPTAPAASPVEFLGGASYLSVWFSLFLATLLSFGLGFMRHRRRTAKR